MKSYKFLRNKGAFIKAGMVQKLSDEKAAPLLEKGVVELVKKNKAKTKSKIKSFKPNKGE